MKTFTLLLFLSLVAIIHSQDCNNPLLSILGISGLSEPTVPTGNLTLCPNFQTQSICCDAETINGFQTNIDEAINNLQSQAIQRDQWLEYSYNVQFPIFLTNFGIFNASMNALRNASQDAFNAAVAKFSYINTTATPLREAMAPLRNNFANYQNARVRCFSTMMDYYASAYCLACNPNYTTLGVNNDGSIILNNRVCNTMRDSCFPFIQLSNSYSLFVALRQVSNQLYEANQFLSGLDLTSNDLVSDIQDETTPYSDNYEAESIMLQNTVLPPNCTATNCTWICTDVFNSARINNQLLALGGVPVNLLSFDDITNRSQAVSRVVSNTASNTTANTTANTTTNTTGGRRFLQVANISEGVPDSANDGDVKEVVTNVASPPPQFPQGTPSEYENIDYQKSAIGPEPAAPGDNDVATGPLIPQATGQANTATGTWNPAVGNSGAAIVIAPNPANVTLATVNENSITTSTTAFQDPPNPDKDIDQAEEAALSGTVLTMSAGLLGILVMFYLE